MPLPFALVCNLLDECQRLCGTGRSNSQAVVDWFARHRLRVDALDTDLSALLSTLLPEKRTDRVYCIQAASLEKLIARALILGSSRVAELARYKQPGLGMDLADCVERILTVTPNPSCSGHDRVTVEELDAALHGVASGIKWSSPAIRRAQTASTPRGRGDIEQIYRRLDAREAKWFTRLVLKDFQPLILESSVYRCCNPLLPPILKIQDDFHAAIRIVRDVKEKLPSSVRAAPADRTALLSLKPQVGVKVGRQNWFKARSIKHGINLGHGRMSIERKIDGEYCQIHVDASVKPHRVQIFSKSGKDSTEDRRGLRGAIYDSLRLGRPGSGIRSRCILEGELVVYSNQEHKILPFHRIRNHVTRRGLFLNTEDDSRPDPSEELMLVYFDILLIDDRSLLDVRHSERFKLLEQTIHPIKGRAELVSRQVVDFGHPYAGSELRRAFAQVIVERGEGLVLKPDEPYFNFRRGDLPFAGRCIKLKKEYIGNLGDVGDFAVVGAGFLAAKARTYNIPNLQWTHFYLGCLDNREQVQRWNATPEFTVVSVVELNVSQLKTVLAFGHPEPIPAAENKATKLKVPKGIETGPPLLDAFRSPLVFDIRCFSFDKPGNTGFWTLRFPCVSKVHFDRDFRETVSFAELEAMARDATTMPTMEDSQENLEWIARLEGADPGGLPFDATTQLTATTAVTPSPVKSTQTSSGRDVRTSVCRSPEGPAAYNHGAMPGNMAPPLALMTSSGSSPSREAASQEKASSSPRKRSMTSLLAAASPTHKRHRSLGSEVVLATPRHDGPRSPLVDLDGNVSQHPTTWRDAPVTVRPGPGHGWEGGKNAVGWRREKDVWRRGGGPSKERSVAADQPCRRPKGRLQRGGDALLLRRRNMPPGRVHTILVSSASLVDAAEPATLLEAHGVLGAAALADRWLEAAAAGGDAPSSPRADKPKMLLVDSIGDGVGTKALVARIEGMQKRLPRRRREWIAVYDWRVLRHITVLEDKSLVSKHFDGFLDPWRRWHCGFC